MIQRFNLSPEGERADAVMVAEISYHLGEKEAEPFAKVYLAESGELSAEFYAYEVLAEPVAGWTLPAARFDTDTYGGGIYSAHNAVRLMRNLLEWRAVNFVLKQCPPSSEKQTIWAKIKILGKFGLTHDLELKPK